MPVITIEGPKLTKEQKEKLIKEYTAISSEVMSIPQESFVIHIKENEPDNIGLGGITLTEKLKRMANSE